MTIVAGKNDLAAVHKIGSKCDMKVAFKMFQCGCEEQYSFGLTDARPSFKVKGAA
jgi:hypothetical protein